MVAFLVEQLGMTIPGRRRGPRRALRHWSRIHLGRTGPCQGRHVRQTVAEQAATDLTPGCGTYLLAKRVRMACSRQCRPSSHHDHHGQTTCGPFVDDDDDVVRLFLTIEPMTQRPQRWLCRGRDRNCRTSTRRPFPPRDGVSQKIAGGCQGVRRERSGLISSRADCRHLHVHVFPAYQLTRLRFVSNVDRNPTPRVALRGLRPRSRRPCRTGLAVQPTGTPRRRCAASDGERHPSPARWLT